MDTLSKPARLDRYTAWGIAVIAVGLYAQSIGFSFVDWDDFAFIVNNPAVAKPSVEGLRQILTPGAIYGEWLYTPVTYLTFFAESAIFGGPNSQTAHFINVLLHALNSALLFRLCRRLKLSLPAAAAAAIIFVVHPLQVESIAWAMGRKDLLATAACFAAMGIWQRDGHRAQWLSAIAVIIAMLAKPTMVILPGILLLLDWHNRQFSSKRLIRLIPAGVAALILLVVNLSLSSGEGGMNLSKHAGRIWQLPWAVCDFLQRALLFQEPDFLYLPHRLTPDTISLPAWIAGLLILGSLWIAYRTNQRRYLFGIFMACIAALPIANVYFASKIFITADRYTYFALAGLCIAAASLPLRQYAWAPVALIVCCSLPRTAQQINCWRDTGTLHAAAIRKNPHSPIFAYSAGRRLESLGLSDSAEIRYRTLLQAEPLDVRAHSRLAIISQQKGDAATAAKHQSIASQLQKILSN